MSGTVPKYQKELLQSAGLWKDFLAFRKDLADQHGYPPDMAKEQALEKFMPTAKIWENRQIPPAAIGVSGEGDRATDEPSLIEIPESVMRSPHDIVAAIEYVAKYIEIGLDKHNVKDAPCAAAVSMLNNYSRDQERKDEFWDSIHTKIVPSKANLERDTDQEFDGEAIEKMTLEILAEMKTYA